MATKKVAMPKKLQEKYRKRTLGLAGVAKELGVSVLLARKRLVEAGVTIHARGRPAGKKAAPEPEPEE